MIAGRGERSTLGGMLRKGLIVGGSAALCAHYGQCQVQKVRKAVATGTVRAALGGTLDMPTEQHPSGPHLKHGVQLTG